MRTHIHCIYSTWTCTITGFPRWTKRNRALLFEKGFFLWSFYVVIMQMSFYLMCPRRMWLALFRLCQCLSTSGPDQSLTWYPIRVVLLAMCAVKIPLHYSFVTQCVKVFFLSVDSGTTLYASVFGGMVKKRNKTSYYFMHLVSFACCFRRLHSVARLCVTPRPDLSCPLQPLADELTPSLTPIMFQMCSSELILNRMLFNTIHSIKPDHVGLFLHSTEQRTLKLVWSGFHL